MGVVLELLGSEDLHSVTFLGNGAFVTVEKLDLGENPLGYKKTNSIQLL